MRAPGRSWLCVVQNLGCAAQVTADRATVTYTYDVPALNQDGEPWVLEEGAWHNDQC